MLAQKRNEKWNEVSCLSESPFGGIGGPQFQLLPTYILICWRIRLQIYKLRVPVVGICSFRLLGWWKIVSSVLINLLCASRVSREMPKRYRTNMIVYTTCVCICINVSVHCTFNIWMGKLHFSTNTHCWLVFQWMNFVQAIHVHIEHYTYNIRVQALAS